MLELAQETVAGFPAFILHFVAGAVLLGIFIAIYVNITPYSEIKLIRDGNAAAAASLSGSILGFTIPLAQSIAQSTDIVEMLVWGAIALVVQLLSFVAARLVIPHISQDIPAGKTAQGIFLGAVSIAAGVLNAACMAD